MYPDVRVEGAFSGESRRRKRMLAVGEVPSEPGGVEARAIPLAREIAREKCRSILWRLRAMELGETARCGAGWQGLPGLAAAVRCTPWTTRCRSREPSNVLWRLSPIKVNCRGQECQRHTGTS